MTAARPDPGSGSDAWYAALADLADEVVFVHREDRSIAFVSPSVEHVLGFTPEEFVTLSTPELIHPDDMADAIETALWLRAEPGRSYRSELRLRHADGHWLWVEIVGRNLLHEPSVEGVINTLRDVTERRAREERLAHQADHDHLTGLANRAYLSRQLAAALDRDPPGTVMVVYLDVDDFKATNDTHGHAAGDEVLRVVAKRLEGVVRDLDLPVRLAGDEFVVLCRSVADDVTAATISERVQRAVRGPAVVGDHDIEIRVSVGSARADEPMTAEGLLERADAALYAAKRAGGDQAVAGPPSDPDALLA